MRGRDGRDQMIGLVEMELGSPDGLRPLLERMASASPPVERVDLGSPMFRFLL